MRFVLVAACVVLGACSLDSSALLPGATNDAAVDSGAGSDSGTRADTGVATDSGSATDTGAAMDSGTPADASPPTDTSPPMDSAAADTGPPPGTVLWTQGSGFDTALLASTGHMEFHDDDFHPDSCRGREVSVFNDPAAASWTDYEATAVMQFWTECDAAKFSLVIRTTGLRTRCDNITGYACTIDMANDRIFARRTDASCATAERSDPVGAGSINSGVDYTLSAQIVGSTLTCTLRDADDVLATAIYTDPAMTHTAGSVAFLFQQTQAAVKNVTVTVR